VVPFLLFDESFYFQSSKNANGTNPMKIATAEKLATTNQACRDFPDTPSLTLARKLYNEHPLWWPNLEAARSSIRMARGNSGKKNKKNACEGRKQLQRPGGKAGFSWQFPKSIKEEWPIFEPKTCRNLILSDLHIPFHDSDAIQCAVKYGKSRNPDAVIINGDLSDFYAISKFDRDPTKAGLRKNIIATRHFLGWLKEKFPKSRIIFKLGNHDEWWEKYLWRKAPELVGLPSVTLEHTLTADFSKDENAVDTDISDMFGDAIDGIEFVGDQRRIMLGQLPVLHGHELPKGMVNPVSFARGMFLRATNHLLCGHSHQVGTHTEKTIMDKMIVTFSTGCLCGLRPTYARVNKYGHGFAFVEVSNNHEFNVDNLRIINGNIY